ncbi:MAG: LCP family protein, partial [Clostridia bacterium]|nr:LCP family protein [Clostridia bacterium]
LPIILACTLLFSFVIYLNASKGALQNRYAATNDDGVTTFLCVGFDVVGNNTDSIILLSLNDEEKSLKILQIPRDTYFSKDTTNGKINQLYSRYYQRTRDHKRAMLSLKESLEDTLSTPIDYYFALNLETLSNVVDRLGGVKIDIPYDVRYEDPEQNLHIELSKGEQILDGERALYFVRYRFGYTDGDLGRVDAQKIFMSSFLNKIRNDTTLAQAISILRECIRKNETDMPFDHMISLATRVLKDSPEYKIYYMTLPGEATRKNIDSGLSYFVVNKAGSIDLIKNYFNSELIPRNFDKDGALVDNSRLNFRNIYYAPSLDYKVYTDEDIKNLKINTKN